MPTEGTLSEKVAYLGRAYAFGSKQVKDNDEIKKEQQILNKKIYERSDEKINEIYDIGRAWSLDYFEIIYRRLGTEHNSQEGKAFDFYIFESKIAGFGRELVEEWLDKKVFAKSDGAVVFPGEQYGVHTRVFINSEGLPTYEAKELGLSKIKYDLFPYDISVVVTGNEINEYFKVLLTVMGLVFPDLAAKTKHLGHGMLRLPTGKMSSRTGDVIVAEDIINQAKEIIVAKMKEGEREIPDLDKTADEIAVAAVKYSILKQDIGKDVIFDFDKSLSFNGNSGPYLQYTYARTQSVLEKAGRENIKADSSVAEEAGEIEKMLYRFPEVVARAGEELAPHHLATYLYELASAFNSYYSGHQIVTKEENAPYRVALTQAIGQVFKNGLTLLGIKTPAKM
jgi:arginyl-tRNA synthetase